ncbi:hypothetical protein PO587_19845 [Streptomyces gilvifuscus]|uniref:Alpha/beta hydrolase n=1 Tax=Streptomyces gilvifuscus TaxID=1550617 RepID=A0ABT5FW49_9ACTN|nr:hypothetical protein [Streptomyces gilvifuscus]MDC2956727.1 hypothetical protein [Streptomyces gilvifuscus]
MKKALLSVCLGANSTVVAWTKHPEEFAEIQALVMLQPLEGRSIGEQFSKVLGFKGGYDRLDQAVLERTGFRLAEQSPAKYASAITVPRLVAQEHDDVMTTPEAVQAVHDAIPVEDKQMHWIHGSTRRFDGYHYFSEHPEVAVDWFDSHVRRRKKGGRASFWARGA